jgi:2-oxo-4-hydroxy-4-carboxy--5-ureidoimidazoline (OHCU) decarboxylase
VTSRSAPAAATRPAAVSRTPATPSIEALDGQRAEGFVNAIGPLFEAAPGFLWRLAAAHGSPFGSPARMFARARDLAQGMPEPLQVDLIEAHPRLGARRDQLSAMSAREQRALGDETSAVLEHLNRDYEARFGFRYCVFVAGRPLAALVRELEAALTADRAAELHRALDAVVDIAEARLAAGDTGNPGIRSEPLEPGR